MLPTPIFLTTNFPLCISSLLSPNSLFVAIPYYFFCFSKIMELSLEVGFFTLALSLLCSFVLAKVIFVVTACDDCEYKSGLGRDWSEYEDQLGNCDWVSDSEVKLIHNVDGSNGSLINGDFEMKGKIDEDEVQGFDIGEEFVEDKLLDQSPEKVSCKFDRELGEGDLGSFNDKEIEVLDHEDNDDCEVKGRNAIEQSVVDDNDEDDDGWEQIESTELERLFSNAVMFVQSRSNADQIKNIGNDAKMHLYSLHKIATVGPEDGPQPMALKISARAKWNAMQQLGNMSPDTAMEHYISLLSMNIPGWTQDKETMKRFLQMLKHPGARL